MKKIICFVAAMFYDEQLYNKPSRMSLAEAVNNLACYIEDGLDVPEGLTPEILAQLWNVLADHA